MPRKRLLQLRAGFCALSFQRQIVDQTQGQRFRHRDRL